MSKLPRLVKLVLGDQTFKVSIAHMTCRKWQSVTDDIWRWVQQSDQQQLHQPQCVSPVCRAASQSPFRSALMEHTAQALAMLTACMVVHVFSQTATVAS